MQSEYDNIFSREYIHRIEEDYQDDLIEAYDRYLDTYNAAHMIPSALNIGLFKRAKIQLAVIDPHMTAEGL